MGVLSTSDTSFAIFEIVSSESSVLLANSFKETSIPLDHMKKNRIPLQID
jgi:hypothetical protein